MKLKIEKSIARGKVEAPPSKSYAHRILIASALAGGESIISNVSQSEDMSATLDCIRALGIDCELLRGEVIFKGKKAQTPAFDELTLKQFDAYLGSSNAPVEDKNAKLEKANVYVNGLLEKGGPSTDVFKKTLGEEKTAKLFKEVLFGTNV
jgi:UDP-N-acetylglucosamine enolpyruvyl transferase